MWAGSNGLDTIQVLSIVCQPIVELDIARVTCCVVATSCSRVNVLYFINTLSVTPSALATNAAPSADAIQPFWTIETDFVPCVTLQFS